MTPTRAALFIRLIGWGFILFGGVFVTLAFAGYDGFAHSLANLFDWTGGPHTEALTRDARWFAAIMSGVCAGFGGLYAFVVAPILTLPDLAARQIAKRGGILSAVLWYVIDSAGSFGAGVPSNVAMNTLFFAAFVLPLLLINIDQDTARAA